MVASVALGGRWRLLEEENLALRAELETRNRAIGLAESTAEHAQQGWRLAEAQAERRRAEAEAAVAEVAALRLQLSSETCKLEEAAAAHGAMSQRADELNAAREALTSEGAQLRATLGNCESAAARFRSAAAGSELKLAREEGLRCEAEASGERLRAELNVAEGRLKNRGTHVELLLREKERLWGQLSRARKRGDATAPGSASSAAPPGTPPRNAALSDSDVASSAGLRSCSTPAPRRAGAGGGYPPGSPGAAGSPSGPGSPGASLGSPSPGAAKAVRNSRGPASRGGGSCVSCAGGAGRCAAAMELERKAWHAQRALERERKSHEETRERLMLVAGA
eukprot:TRINITY_DN3540_c0_g1_i5.p1 TRINITY_DN3540_c0_g1~~TRINITY_DN3540_c0_g1_i5.p1  ORF type:complete len:338 (-),score=81.52 TRINITY_DN3540_c0_g1_i5:90-1103(-)